MSINRFIDQLRPSDVALIYYAGHGVQIDNENYLVPIDLQARDQADVRYGSYSAPGCTTKFKRQARNLRFSFSMHVGTILFVLAGL